MPANKNAVKAWICYDWANSAFATSIIATLMPIYFHDIIATEVEASLRTAIWGYATSISLALIALLSPIMGWLADRYQAHKLMIVIMLGLGCGCTMGLAFMQAGDTIFAAALYIVANFAFVGGNVFYNSLLDGISHDAAHKDKISLLGYGFGYLGGGVLLLCHILLIQNPEFLGLSSKTAAIKVSIFSVSIWWALFSLPLLFLVPQPAEAKKSLDPLARKTLDKLKAALNASPLVLPFLIAFWLYGDGIGTIYRMASTFASEVGIDRSGILSAILMVQFLGMPFTFAFLPLAKRIGTLNALQIALGIYLLVCLVGYQMQTTWQFFVLAGLVAMAQGPAQALSRSYFSRIINKEHAGLMFGFYAVTDKFAGIFGPLIFGLLAHKFGASRLSILFLALLFVVGVIGIELVKKRERRLKTS